MQGNNNTIVAEEPMFAHPYIDLQQVVLITDTVLLGHEKLLQRGGAAETLSSLAHD